MSNYMRIRYLAINYFYKLQFIFLFLNLKTNILHLILHFNKILIKLLIVQIIRVLNYDINMKNI